MKQKRTRLVLITSALLSAVLLTSCSSQTPEVSPTSADSCERAVTAGLSAYELWITQGNTGSLQDFFDSLVGEKGENGYVGADGVNGEPGAPGAPGASAYQLWLDAGNSGTSEDFLNSIAGADGLDGLNGLSAYQLWLSLGNVGTTQDFLDSLVGATGQQGIPGVCTAGDVGPQGPAGPVGPSGSPGPTGATGSQGPQGIQGIQGIQGPAGGFGAYGSFFHLPNQPLTGGATSPILVTTTDFANGVSIVDDYKITFVSAGKYNIMFSSQLKNTSNARRNVTIWLSKNGITQNQWVSETSTDYILGTSVDAEKGVAVLNFFVDAAPGDFFVLMIASSGNGVVIDGGTSLNNSLNVPNIPATILTVNQVG
ncbi:hypothetical protein AINA4_09170 [Aurantimicrobium sp. INA4]|uniref:hypothetical protein n=1 Tax=Aurantimicrobium sp. INA4 TaxID=2986279 RepID=UPI0024908C4F|nr:hypothetical protein [Aurantimicrobium sp. INA4]BDU10996.1 hypothetical protein AINA4_09170 [Aurantimicrobium sp. INA4]